MAYLKFKADQLFDGHHFREDGSVLITTIDGMVEAIVPSSEAGDDVQTFTGILSPGLINCHCHLELSHLKNVIPPYTGLIDFLCSVVTKRDFATEIIQQEIINAEKEMYDNGCLLYTS
ncbi:MAG: amidohydrolase, partial [Chitinophagaceae bacterium]